jgi:aryl-alcohol dehydrogenase-like predicted oxidoreductase
VQNLSWRRWIPHPAERAKQNALIIPMRQLGSSSLHITVVGLGSWAFGKNGWGRQRDDDSIATIRHAVSAGINWIDTAAIYGLGHSEEIIANALAGMSAADRPHVFTKVGVSWDPSSQVTRHVLDPVVIRRELDASLRRLQVDCVDLYQVHKPPRDDCTPLEVYWQTMADLKAAGKVRLIGLSNHDVAMLDRAERIAHVDSLQPPLSVINRLAAAEIAWAAEHGTGVIVYSPLQSGLLTGEFTAERAANLPADDWRRAHRDFTSDLIANLALADRLGPIARRHGVPVSAVAVAWTLAWPGVTGAIVGARHPDQLLGWLSATRLHLAEEDQSEIAAAILATRAGSGPPGFATCE